MVPLSVKIQFENHETSNSNVYSVCYKLPMHSIMAKTTLDLARFETNYPS